MAQWVREFLTDNPQGWSRLELKVAVARQLEFAAQFERNPGAYYNMIGRLLHRGDLEDRDGLLFASEKTLRQLVDARKSPSRRADAGLRSASAKHLLSATIVRGEVKPDQESDREPR
jgi:hypothetical protein